jgi:hypothetical protein
MFFSVSATPGFGFSSWGRGVSYLCLASIALNLVLVAFLLLAKHPRGSTAVTGVMPTTEHKQGSPAEKKSWSSLSSTETNPPPTFSWAEVEAADYRQYVMNLRAVGCPEETIRDIVAADIAGHYAPRAEAIWKPQVRSYWQKQIRDQPDPVEMKELMALGENFVWRGASYQI